MSSPHSRRIDPNDPQQRGKQAKQIAELLDQFIAEYQYIQSMLDFFERLASRQYPDHRRLQTLLKKEDHRFAFGIRDLSQLSRQYHRVLEDFEHTCGAVETPSLLPMFNYTISILDLLDLFPMDRVVEDFLDG